MNKIEIFLVRAVSGIILFAIYIVIAYNVNSCNLPYGLAEDKFCVCIEGIITPIWCFLSVKFLRLDYEKVPDYIPLGVIFFALLKQRRYCGDLLLQLCSFIYV